MRLKLKVRDEFLMNDDDEYNFKLNKLRLVILNVENKNKKYNKK